MTCELLIFGHGYTGSRVAALARRAGWRLHSTTRRHEAATVLFADAGPYLHTATHLLATAPPDDAGDPVLRRYAAAIEAAPVLRHICYLSTTGVYGDRGGGTVDETTAPAPGSPRGRRRLLAEQQWARLADRRAVELFRLAGIYGPGRSAFDDLRAGTARRIIAPDHRFGRIHVDDIAGAVMAAMGRTTTGVRVLHGNDDLPAASADVVEEAARLLGIAPPPAQPLAAVMGSMSEMARSFWAENRIVASRLTQQALDRCWTYPTYREGLAAILTVERHTEILEQPFHHRQV